MINLPNNHCHTSRMLNLGLSTNASGSRKINEISARIVPMVDILAAIDQTNNCDISNFFTGHICHILLFVPKGRADIPDFCGFLRITDFRQFNSSTFISSSNKGILLFAFSIFGPQN